MARPEQRKRTAPAANGSRPTSDPLRKGRTILSRVNAPGQSPVRSPDSDAVERGIMSTRALLILILAAAAALIAGVSAGVSVSIAVTRSFGVAGCVAIGVLAGIGAGIVTGLATASALNSIVSRS